MGFLVVISSFHCHLFSKHMTFLVDYSILVSEHNIKSVEAFFSIFWEGCSVYFYTLFFCSCPRKVNL